MNPPNPTDRGAAVAETKPVSSVVVVSSENPSALVRAYILAGQRCGKSDSSIIVADATAATPGATSTTIDAASIPVWQRYPSLTILELIPLASAVEINALLNSGNQQRPSGHTRRAWLKAAKLRRNVLKREQNSSAEGDDGTTSSRAAGVEETATP